MITLTYQKINEPAFHTAMRKLVSTPLPIKVGYNIKKIAEEVDRARKQIGDQFLKEVLHKYAEKTEAGDFVRPEDNPQGFKIEDQKAFDDAHDKFGTQTLMIERNKIPVDNLEGHVKLTAQEISALEEILSELALVPEFVQPVPPPVA